MATNLNSQPGTASPTLGLSASWQTLGPQDWLVFSYLSLMCLAAITAPAHPVRSLCILQMSSLWLVFCAVTLVVRTRSWQRPAAPAFVYRVTLFTVILTSYLFLDHFLPLVNPRNLDQELHALDLFLFGFEPAVLLDRYVTPFRTEWFSFFYFGYFWLVWSHIFPIMFITRDERRLGEFGLGLLTVYVVGQSLYMFVPGFGPIVALADDFTHPLPQGFWLDAVMKTVHSGGAQKDIFPSLHTAAPTFLTLFSIRHRRLVPYRYTWPVVAFFTLNIVLATMYLRWHWLIDVIAGVCLAALALQMSVWATERELARRARLGLGETWCELRRPRPQA